MTRRLLRIITPALLLAGLATGGAALASGTAQAAPAAHTVVQAAQHPAAPVIVQGVQRPAIPDAVQETQYCDSLNWCQNAWGGQGGYDNEYDSDYANDLMTLGATGGYSQLVSVANGSDENCLGDYGNNANDARAGFPATCSASSKPWGANLVLTFCDNDGGWTMYDVHWGGYVAPNKPEGPGQAIYLNSATAWCWIGYDVN